MSDREFIHDVVLQVAAVVAFFAIMYAITAWNCARCDAALEAVARDARPYPVALSAGASGSETLPPLEIGREVAR